MARDVAAQRKGQLRSGPEIDLLEDSPQRDDVEVLVRDLDADDALTRNGRLDTNCASGECHGQVVRQRFDATDFDLRRRLDFVLGHYGTRVPIRHARGNVETREFGRNNRGVALVIHGAVRGPRRCDVLEQGQRRQLVFARSLLRRSHGRSQLRLRGHVPHFTRAADGRAVANGLVLAADGIGCAAARPARQRAAVASGRTRRHRRSECLGLRPWIRNCRGNGRDRVRKPRSGVHGRRGRLLHSPTRLIRPRRGAVTGSRCCGRASISAERGLRAVGQFRRRSKQGVDGALDEPAQWRHYRRQRHVQSQQQACNHKDRQDESGPGSGDQGRQEPGDSRSDAPAPRDRIVRRKQADDSEQREIRDRAAQQGQFPVRVVALGPV